MSRTMSHRVRRRSPTAAGATALRLGLSLSIPDGLAVRELDAADLTRFAVRLTRIVLDRGGGVVSGHDWRPRGVMRALLHFARRYSMEDQLAGTAPLQNFIPWPDRSALDERQLAGLAHVLRVVQVGLPSWCRQVLTHLGEPGHPHQRLARLFAVSELRRRITEAADARVCLGGKQKGYSGRYPGIVEEIALALAKRQPVYLVGWAGGISSDVIDLLRNGRRGKQRSRADAERGHELFPAFAKLRPKLKAAGAASADWLPDPLGPWAWSYGDLLQYVLDQRGMFSREGNGLAAAENERLWATDSIDESVDLILLGLSRLGMLGNAPARPGPAPRATRRRQ